MGLFGRQHQTAKKKRNDSVGIAEENDSGSFSGLEVDIDYSIDIDKEETDTEKERKTAKNKKKKPTSEIPKSTFRAAGFFFRNNSCRNKRKGTHRGCVNEESHRPLPVNQTYSSSSSYDCNYNGSCNSSGSNDLSIYTSGSNDNDVSGNSNGKSTTAASNGVFVTLDHVFDLVLDLDTAVAVGAKRPIRALKMLLALSSTSSSSMTSSSASPSSSIKSIHDTRIEMVNSENGKLVSVLLSFLNRCMVQSKEHILTLLLLSNLSIPQENKTVSFFIKFYCIRTANKAIFETNFIGTEPSS